MNGLAVFYWVTVLSYCGSFEHLPEESSIPIVEELYLPGIPWGIRRGTFGTVVAAFTITPEGRVEQLEILDESKLEGFGEWLSSQVLQALGQWRYQPDLNRVRIQHKIYFVFEHYFYDDGEAAPLGGARFIAPDRVVVTTVLPRVEIPSPP